MNELSNEMNNIPSKEKQQYEKALGMSPEYVNSRNFRLKFLRAEEFNPKLAAARMALHFEQKYELFGEDKLGRDIYMRDLNEDDMDCLKTGYLQVLKELDFGNRRVIFYYRALHGNYKHRDNLLRTYWYVTNVLSESEDVQKLGVANVVYNVGGYYPEGGMDWEKSRRLAKLFRAIPLKFCSFYPCIDTKAWTIVVDTFSVVMSKWLRFRLRAIKGSHDEVMLKLKAVGIPAESLPVNDKSELIVDDHLAWIEEQQKKEEEEDHLEPARKKARAWHDAPIAVQTMYETDALSKLCTTSSCFYTVG